MDLIIEAIHSYGKYHNRRQRLILRFGCGYKPEEFTNELIQEYETPENLEKAKLFIQTKIDEAQKRCQELKIVDMTSKEYQALFWLQQAMTWLSN